MNKSKVGVQKLIRIFTSWRFIFFLLWKLPMGFFARLRVIKLDLKKSHISVPYNFWNKNPFNSMYFAVQSMAAELSTGVLVLLHTDGKNISMLVTECEAKYYKKATSNIEFICLDGDKILSSVNTAINMNQPQLCIMKSKGYDKNGVCVSEFFIKWSLKKRF